MRQLNFLSTGYTYTINQKCTGEISGAPTLIPVAPITGQMPLSMLCHFSCTALAVPVEAALHCTPMKSTRLLWFHVFLSLWLIRKGYKLTQYSYSHLCTTKFSFASAELNPPLRQFLIGIFSELIVPEILGFPQ